MTEKKFCPKCGTENAIEKKFCRNCGERLPSANPAGGNIVETSSAVLNTVASTVSRVESTMRTAAKIGSAAEQISQFTVRPPAEWKVVVGEMAPQLGKNAVDTAVQTAVSQTQAKMEKRVEQEITSRIGDTNPQPYRESAAPPEAPPGHVCASCGFTSPGGTRFCGGCGAALRDGPVRESLPTSVPCSSCGRPMRAGAKFCGSCGAGTKRA